MPRLTRTCIWAVTIVSCAIHVHGYYTPENSGTTALLEFSLHTVNGPGVQTLQDSGSHSELQLPVMQFAGELDAAQRALDDANATLAQALALDTTPSDNTSTLEEQLRAANSLEQATVQRDITPGSSLTAADTDKPTSQGDQDVLALLPHEGQNLLNNASISNLSIELVLPLPPPIPLMTLAASPSALDDLALSSPVPVVPGPAPVNVESHPGDILLSLEGVVVASPLPFSAESPIS